MEDPVIIIGRGKDLKLVLERTFPIAAHSCCCQHLPESLALKSSRCKQSFWQAAHAKTENRFKRLMGLPVFLDAIEFCFLSLYRSKIKLDYCEIRLRLGKKGARR